MALLLAWQFGGRLGYDGRWCGRAESLCSSTVLGAHSTSLQLVLSQRELEDSSSIQY